MAGYDIGILLNLRDIWSYVIKKIHIEAEKWKMAGLIIALFVAIARCNDPFSEPDPVHADLPFEGDGEQDAEVEEPEMPTETPSPTPTPAPVPREMREVIGLPELFVAGGFVMYLVIFLVGRAYIKAKLGEIKVRLFESLRRHFAIVPEEFQARNVHTFDAWVTGRTGYQGGFITQRFKKTCDPLGISMSLFQGSADTLTMEFLVKPKHLVSLVFHVSRENPQFVESMKLKSYNLPERLTVWTDLADQRGAFMTLVNAFIEGNPGVLDMIEVSDVNRFETKDNNKYVARFQFKIIGAISDVITDELIDFCISMTDKFASMKLPRELQIKHEKVRATLARENEPKEEKQLTPEEEERLAKKRERRDAKRSMPKMKMVRQ